MAVKKSIAVIGEGETEWFYFESLRTARRYPFKMAPDFPSHPDIEHVLKLAKEYVKKGYDSVICLIDMDYLHSFSAEMSKYQKAKASKSNSKIVFIETDPCTEFWFLLHFLPNLSTKHYSSCDSLLHKLQKYMPGYEKSKKYFTRTNIYNYLCTNGDLNRAMKNSEKLCELAKISPEDDYSYSEIHKALILLDEINKDEIKEKENRNI